MAVAKVWNGNEWVAAKWKTHHGGEWVEQSKVWDGNEWVLIGKSGLGLPLLIALTPSGAGNGRVVSWSG